MKITYNRHDNIETRLDNFKFTGDRSADARVFVVDLKRFFLLKSVRFGGKIIAYNDNDFSVFWTWLIIKSLWYFSASILFSFNKISPFCIGFSICFLNLDVFKKFPIPTPTGNVDNYNNNNNSIKLLIDRQGIELVVLYYVCQS